MHGPCNYVDRTCERSANYSARTFSCYRAKPKILSNCCLEATESLTRDEKFREFYQEILYLHVSHTSRGPPKVPLQPLSETFLRIPKQHFVFVSSPKKQTHIVCNNRPNIANLSNRGRTAKLHFVASGTDDLSSFKEMWDKSLQQENEGFEKSMKMFQENQKMQLEQKVSLLTGFKDLLKDLVKE